MAKVKDKRANWLHIRISQREYDLLQDWRKQSTCRKLSELVRDVLFRRPIRIYYRSKSADEFLSTALKLKNELNSIGNNLNQAVKGLHSFRTDQELYTYLFNLEADRKMILSKTREIQLKIQDIYDLLIKEARSFKSGIAAPILSDGVQAAAADQRENKAGQ